MLLIFNAAQRDVQFHLPALHQGQWHTLLDSTSVDLATDKDGWVQVPAHAVLALEAQQGSPL